MPTALTLEDIQAAELALALYISGQPEPRLALLSMITQPDFKLRLATDLRTPTDLAREAIRMSLVDGWPFVPPWLLQILSRVVQTVEVARLLEKVRTIPAEMLAPPPVDPFDALWLPESGLPFVNRRKLREQLRRLDAETGPSVLIINGPKQYGKSYSIELLYHVVRANILPGAAPPIDIPIAVVLLQKGQGASLTPEVLSTKIIEQITRDPLPAPDLEGVTPDRRNERLCEWIITNAQQAGKKWWVVLDCLDDPDLTPDTRHFISKLVELLSIGRFRNNLRLIITDYPLAQLSGVPASQLEYEDLSRIGEVDVELFFRQLFQEPGGPPPPPLAVKTAVILAMRDLPENETRHYVLNANLREVLKNANL